jgi:hypothetical protein
MTQIGFYPDTFGRRMGYDADGTIGGQYTRSNQTFSQWSAGTLAELNDEDSGQVLVFDGFAGAPTFFYQGPLLIFPELRDIAGYVMSWSPISYQNLRDFEYSSDTTNGIDGTWTLATPFSVVTHSSTIYRTTITACPLSNVKAIRWTFGSGGNAASDAVYLQALHIYGMKTAGQTPHRIDFTYTDGSELAQDFDYGDQPRGSERIWTPAETWNIGSPLYLRNRSPEKIATEVVLTIQSLTGTMVNNLSLSKDNISYANQLSWTDIQPLQKVGPIFVKHNVLVGTTLGLYTARLKVAVGEWQ